MKKVIAYVMNHFRLASYSSSDLQKMIDKAESWGAKPRKKVASLDLITLMAKIEC